MPLKSFPLHTSMLSNEGCPVDPTSPVPPPWDAPPSGEGQRSATTESALRSASGGRVSEVGQMLAKYARNPALTPYEQIFRSEPNESWFDPARDPNHPTQFEIGTIRPGRAVSIVLMDYSVTPYGFSGLTPNDYESLEDNRISGSFGYTLTINGQSPGILRYFLDPVRSTLRQQAFRFNQRPLDFSQIDADDFVRSQAAEYASAAGMGTSLHPQTSDRFNGRIIPFGEFIHNDEVAAVGGVVFRAVEVPLAFVQVRFSGFQMASSIAHEVQRALAEAMR